MISTERAAAIAQDFLDDEVSGPETKMVLVPGAHAVVEGSFYFDCQSEAYLDSGDPSEMAIGVGYVCVDGNTGACWMLGVVEAARLSLFDDLPMAGPGGWRRIPEDRADAWRAAFRSDPTACDLCAPCPQCGTRNLHRWYGLAEPCDLAIPGPNGETYGRLWEWCSSCHFFTEDQETVISTAWVPPYGVPDDRHLWFTPEHVENARQDHY